MARNIERLVKQIIDDRIKETGAEIKVVTGGDGPMVSEERITELEKRVSKLVAQMKEQNLAHVSSGPKINLHKEISGASLLSKKSAIH